SARNAGSGDITIDTSADSTVSGNGAGILATATGSGDIFIANAGHVTSSGALWTSAIVINGNTTGTATITNSAAIGPQPISASTSAIFEAVSSLTIDNAGGGVINGHITAAHTTFHNEAGATWNTGGASSFGAVGDAAASTIDNAGTINLSYNASL